MNYTGIINTALAYADRTDQEVTINMDNFLRLVESRINRKIKTSEMAQTAYIPTSSGSSFYGLPKDFAGMRDIQVNALDENGNPVVSDNASQTLIYTTPEGMTEALQSQITQYYYTIISEQIQISYHPDDAALKITYYRKIPPLTANDDSNWLSVDNPDAYIFGLLVEISSFTKDAAAKAIWDERFLLSLGEIKTNDKSERWSGVPLKIGFI